MTQTIAEFLKANCKAGDRVCDNGVEYCVRKASENANPTLCPTDFIHEILWGDRLDRSLKQPSVWRRKNTHQRQNCFTGVEQDDYRIETWQRIAQYEPVRESSKEEKYDKLLEVLESVRDSYKKISLSVLDASDKLIEELEFLKG